MELLQNRVNTDPPRMQISFTPDHAQALLTLALASAVFISVLAVARVSIEG